MPPTCSGRGRWAHRLVVRLSVAGHAAHEIREASGSPPDLRVRVLDDIQYLADGERHLKVFVDARPHVKCFGSVFSNER